MFIIIYFSTKRKIEKLQKNYEGERGSCLRLKAGTRVKPLT